MVRRFQLGIFEERNTRCSVYSESKYKTIRN